AATATVEAAKSEYSEAVRKERETLDETDMLVAGVRQALLVMFRSSDKPRLRRRPVLAADRVVGLRCRGARDEMTRSTRKNEHGTRVAHAARRCFDIRLRSGSSLRPLCASRSPRAEAA